MYLAPNFAAPVKPSTTKDVGKQWGGVGIGHLDTADPLNPEVQKWWMDKVNEIYSLIPDFGGFLVKANSEGMAGPQDYHRSHVDGANMLAVHSNLMEALCFGAPLSTIRRLIKIE